MKILIHALGADMGGAVRHLSNFIPALLEEDKKNTYYLLIKNSLPFSFTHASLHIKRIKSKLLNFFIFRIFIDLFYIPYLALKLNAGLVISLLNFGPAYLTKPHISFQQNAIYFCKEYLSNIKGKPNFVSHLRSILIYLTMRSSDTIIIPSDSMKEIIHDKYPSLSKKKFITIYHGFNSGSLFNNHSIWEEKLKNDNRFKILYPTHLGLHKGFELIPSILRLLKKNGNNFVLFTTISRNDWAAGYDSFEKDINSTGLKDNVVITGRLSQEEIGVFYKYSDVMLYTSRCESFGFSMLEAMGYSLPIVALNTPVNREICGNAAFYFSFDQPESCSRLINNLRNPLLREELEINSKKRMEEFDWSWERSANQWIKLINHYGNG